MATPATANLTTAMLTVVMLPMTLLAMVILTTTITCQTACKRMPKELRSWDAYLELTKQVDDFLESLPLIQQLAHPALRQRHWDKLCELTGKTFDVNSDLFKLCTLLDAGLLECVEEVCSYSGVWLWCVAVVRSCGV